MDLCFLKKKKRQGCTTQKSGLGMQQQIGYHNPKCPNVQISNLEVPVGMVDGILTKLRNPVNQDLWLTDRFGTSVNHPLFLSLPYWKHIVIETFANRFCLFSPAPVLPTTTFITFWRPVTLATCKNTKVIGEQTEAKSKVCTLARIAAVCTHIYDKQWRYPSKPATSLFTPNLPHLLGLG